MESGMEVLYLGLRQSAERVATAARDEDPDVVGFSILSGAHVPICEKFATLRKHFHLEDMLWLVGGNIPSDDHAHLHDLGVDAVFPTGSSLEDIVETITKRAGVEQT
jgi:methylmalonyl-CoA mutase C-terminal domain/subunit